MWQGAKQHLEFYHRMSLYSTTFLLSERAKICYNMFFDGFVILYSVVWWQIQMFIVHVCGDEWHWWDDYRVTFCVSSVGEGSAARRPWSGTRQGFMARLMAPTSVPSVATRSLTHPFWQSTSGRTRATPVQNAPRCSGMLSSVLTFGIYCWLWKVTDLWGAAQIVSSCCTSRQEAWLYPVEMNGHDCFSVFQYYFISAFFKVFVKVPSYQAILAFDNMIWILRDVQCYIFLCISAVDPISHCIGELTTCARQLIIALPVTGTGNFMPVISITWRR